MKLRLIALKKVCLCERFYKTYLQDFYQPTFRRKLYASLEELRSDLGACLEHYNNERTHQGKMCCGRASMHTMLDGESLLEEKPDS